MMRSLAISLVVAAMCLGSAAQQATAPMTRPEDAATQQDFMKRVDQYYALRNKLGGNDTQRTSKRSWQRKFASSVQVRNMRTSSPIKSKNFFAARSERATVVEMASVFRKA
jgi:hypothetical protein